MSKRNPVFKVAAVQAAPLFLDKDTTVLKACDVIDQAGPLEAKHSILYADIDLNEIPAQKWLFDVAGHYARPDVFDFAVKSR